MQRSINNSPESYFILFMNETSLMIEIKNTMEKNHLSLSFSLSYSIPLVKKGISYYFGIVWASTFSDLVFFDDLRFFEGSN